MREVEGPVTELRSDTPRREWRVLDTLVPPHSEILSGFAAATTISYSGKYSDALLRLVLHGMVVRGSVVGEHTEVNYQKVPLGVLADPHVGRVPGGYHLDITPSESFRLTVNSVPRPNMATTIFEEARIRWYVGAMHNDSSSGRTAWSLMHLLRYVSKHEPTSPAVQVSVRCADAQRTSSVAQKRVLWQTCSRDPFLGGRQGGTPKRDRTRYVLFETTHTWHQDTKPCVWLPKRLGVLVSASPAYTPLAEKLNLEVTSGYTQQGERLFYRTGIGSLMQSESCPVFPDGWVASTPFSFPLLPVPPPLKSIPPQPGITLALVAEGAEELGALQELSAKCVRSSGGELGQDYLMITPFIFGELVSPCPPGRSYLLQEQEKEPHGTLPPSQYLQDLANRLISAWRRKPTGEKE